MVSKSKFIKPLAIFIAIAGVVVGLSVSLRTVYEIAGGWGVALGLLVFPLTFAYIPFYMLLAHGSWNLLLLNYGSIAVSWGLLYFADKLEAAPEQPRAAIDEPPTQPVVTKENPSPAVIFLIVGGVILAAIICALALRAI
jgi:hypothetical protein